MSVLNKMLKDLEQRQGQLSPGAGIPAGVQVAGPAPRSRLVGIAMLLVPAVLLAAGLAAYWLGRSQAVAPVPAVRTEAQLTISPVQNAVLLPAATASAAETSSPSQNREAVPQAPAATVVLAAAPVAEPVPAQASAATAPPPAAPVSAAASQPAPVIAVAATSENPALKQISAAQTADYQYQRALLALEQGHVSEATALLHSLLHTFPRHPSARQVLATVLINASSHKEAEGVLQEGQRLFPADLDMVMMLARLQMERGDGLAAIDTLQTSIAHAVDSGNYLAFKASLHQKQNQHQSAADLLMAALKTSANNGKWLLALAVSQQALGQGKAARGSAEAALSSGNLAPELQPMAQQLATTAVQ